MTERQGRAGWIRAVLAGGFLLAAGSAWGWIPKTPYPLVAEQDAFALEKTLPDTAWQVEKPEVLVGDKGWKIALGTLSPDGKGIDPFLVRTTRGTGGLAFRIIKDGDAKRPLTVTVTGDSLTASALTLLSGDTSRDMTLNWSFKSDSPAMLQGKFLASFDTASAEIPFAVALLRSPDLFEIGFGVSSAEPAAYRTGFFLDQGGPVDVPVLARPGDVLWVRVVNRGTNVLETTKTGLTPHRICFDGRASGAKYVFPAFGMVVKSDALTAGDTTLAFAVPYAGGNRPAVNFPLTVHVKNYTVLGTAASADGAALQPIKMALPGALPTLLPMEGATLSAEAVHPKYTPLVQKVFRAVTFDAPVFTIPGAGKFAALPVLVTWRFSSNDLVVPGILTAAQAEVFLNGVRGGGDAVRTLLNAVGVYKHFADKAVDLRTIVPTADLSRYFEVGYDGATVTLTFRVLVVDSPEKKVDGLLDGGVGWFVLYDGAEDRRFFDPLCLAYTPFSGGISPTPTQVPPTPTPGPGTPTVAPKPADSGKGGCSLGVGPSVLFFVAPLALMILRR